MTVLPALLSPTLKGFKRQGAGNHVALRHIAPQSSQCAESLFGFHPFGHHPQRQRVPQTNSGKHTIDRLCGVRSALTSSPTSRQNFVLSAPDKLERKGIPTAVS